MSDTRVDISSMTNIQLGQTTATFQKHKAPELIKSSFSIMYDMNRKSLDLIAKDSNDYKIWTNGLKQLIILNRKSTDLSDLTTLYIDVPINKSSSRNSTSEPSYNNNHRSVTPQTRTARTMTQDDTFASKYHTNQSSNDNNNTSKSDSSINKKLVDMKKRLDKRRIELKDRIYSTSPAYESMQTLVKRINESLNKANEYVTEDDQQSADDEIWRCTIDLQSLSAMMNACQ